MLAEGSRFSARRAVAAFRRVWPALSRESPGRPGYPDANGKIRAWITAGGFAYFDEKECERAVLGVVETVSEKTQKESRYPAGVALFDDDGHVIWMAPQ